MELINLLDKEVKIRKPEAEFDNLSEAPFAQIDEIKEEKVIIICEKGLNFETDDLIQIIYIDNAKGIHYFNTEVKEIDNSVIKVRAPEFIQRYQRRQYLRVKYKTEIEFRPVSYQGENLTHLEEKRGLGQMVDISAGGVCFTSDIELLEGLVIETSFELGDSFFQNLGEVVRIIEKEDEVYEMGIKFDLKSKKVENEISNFALKQQIINHKKEKLKSEDE
jgi:c-di-GMP-binding flagellar brake protein YcgR